MKKKPKNKPRRNAIDGVAVRVFPATHKKLKKLAAERYLTIAHIVAERF